MTECERLIANGTFTRDFFKPEVRCDFLVDEKRKKIWAIQIDLYLQLARVCKKYGFRYCATGGTVLGAVRHKGYIPWDDDMDVFVFREDYERLKEIAPKEFQHPYFLQVPGRDHEYAISFSKLRNSNTSQVSLPLSHCHFNQGVQIDVFPLDKWDSKTGQQHYERIKELNVDNSNGMRQGHPNPDSEMLKRMMQWSGRSTTENSLEIEAIARRYENSTDFDSMTNPVSTVYPHEKVCFPKECFDSFIKVPFENVSMLIPRDYDKFLTRLYGDWRQLPPVEKRGNWHANSCSDPDVPYTEFLKKIV